MTGTPTVVLAADVGGTNTKLALAQCGGGKCLILTRSVYASGEHAAFERIVEAFLREPQVAAFAPGVAAACFAVAGPVEDGCARLTNLTWRIDERDLARHFAISRVSVINDFAAAGLGIAQLAETDLLTLQHGTPVAHADRVVIGAGTGLGVAWLTWDDGRYRVHPSEGGHAGFAPVDEDQDQLLQRLRAELGHVSAERIVSGPGLERIFKCLQDSGYSAPGQALLDAMAKGDNAGAISEFALGKRDVVAERALDVFVSAYGAFAGNMALIGLARGGIYIAGGIAPKIAAKLQDGTFMRSFAGKGRFRTLLESFPVKVVMNAQVGLLGAIAEAARLGRD